MCSSELDPVNYPPVQRFHRPPYPSDDDDDLLKSGRQRSSSFTGGSPGRRSFIKNMVHVMSYNVLADHLATPQFHPFQSSQVMDFTFRATRIIEEIKQSDASIICLQEVDHIDDFYDNQLKDLGFNVVYGHRTLVEDGEKEPHTIAIAYKQSEWALIDTELVDLGEISRWFPTEERFKKMTNRNAMLCMLQHQ